MWSDPFGIMEWLSRKTQASIFVYCEWHSSIDCPPLPCPPSSSPSSHLIRSPFLCSGTGGRAFLPVPFRANVTLVLGEQIWPAEDLGFPPCEDPPQEQIEKVHALLLERIESSFNEWKGALGWGHKTLRIV